MTTKELNIEVPNGYDIDVEKSDLKTCKVCFKKIKQVDQHDFDDFFKSLLHRASQLVFINDNGDESILPTNHFTLYDSDSCWLFDVRTDENPHFWYSYYKILPLFKEKFKVGEQQLSYLMIPMIKQMFDLKHITPCSITGSPTCRWSNCLI